MTDNKQYPKLPNVGPIGYASVVDIDLYETRLSIGPHLPGVRDVALWTTDQMRAFADATCAMRAAQATPAAWMDDGTLRSGSTETSHRVVTAKTKAGMPSSTAAAFTVPLYTKPAAPASQDAEALMDAIDDMRAAVQYAPSSAYWSERLKHHFGADARKGIDALEQRLRDAQGAQATQDVEEKKLRRMLCVAYSGTAAYMDDGEASDARAHPFIDFMRDSVDEIQAKMRERGVKEAPALVGECARAKQEGK